MGGDPKTTTRNYLKYYIQGHYSLAMRFLRSWDEAHTMELIHILMSLSRQVQIDGIDLPRKEAMKILKMVCESAGTKIAMENITTKLMRRA